MAVFAAMAYRAMRMTTVRGAVSRAQATSQQLASILDVSMRNTLTQAAQEAALAPLGAFLRAPGAATRTAAESTVHALAHRSAQVLLVELRDAAGQTVLSAGRFAAEHPLTAPRAGRAAEISPLHRSGDTIWIDVAARVSGAGVADTLGTLVEYIQISSAQSTHVLGDLIGPKAMFLVGNADGSMWTDLAHQIPGPVFDQRRPAGVTRDTVGGGRLGAIAPMTAAPWLVWVAMPMDTVLAPARTMLHQLLLAGLVILAAGVGAAWWSSRRLTRPLVEVARAAEGITAGDYTRRATVTRRDEVGQLAASFNTMAAQIEEGRRTLEQRVTERTAELRTALDQLSATQQELVRTEKLAFLGQLAGGVGHELRNPLGVMTNAVHYLGLVLQNAPPKVTEYLGILRAQIGLAERIVGDLLDSARVKTPQQEPVPAQQLFADQLQRVAVHRGITVETDVPPDFPYLFVDRVQIGQVMLNLISNAVQAIGERDGTLTLRARMNGDQKAQLDVVDTGPGIAPEHLQRIFEPLFTTKARGLGLGLSVARSLARANGGELTAASEPGRGSTFTVSVPVVGGSSA